MKRPRVADRRNGLQMWRKAENLLNKQSRTTAGKGWSSNLGVGRRDNNSSTKKKKLFTKRYTGPQNWAENFLTNWVTIRFWRRTTPWSYTCAQSSWLSDWTFALQWEMTSQRSRTPKTVSCTPFTTIFAQSKRNLNSMWLDDTASGFEPGHAVAGDTL